MGRTCIVAREFVLTINSPFDGDVLTLEGTLEWAGLGNADNSTNVDSNSRFLLDSVVSITEGRNKVSNLSRCSDFALAEILGSTKDGRNGVPWSPPFLICSRLNSKFSSGCSMLEGETDAWTLEGLISLNKLNSVEECVVSVGSGNLSAVGIDTASLLGICEFEAN